MEHWDVQPRKSLGEKFSNAVGVGLQGAGQLYQQHQQKKQQEMQMQQENEAARQMGFDLSGITDPKTRQQLFGLAMQGGNQQQLEMLKQQGKQQQIGQKQDFLSNLFGGEQGQNQGQQGLQ